MRGVTLIKYFIQPSGDRQSVFMRFNGGQGLDKPLIVELVNSVLVLDEARGN